MRKRRVFLATVVVGVLTTLTLFSFTCRDKHCSLFNWTAPTTVKRENRNAKLPLQSAVLERVTGYPPSYYKEQPEELPDRKFKIILFWNEAYGNKNFGFGFGQTPFLEAGCHINSCIATGNRTRYPLKDVDAVIWHLRSNDKSFPPERSPHTRYVMWMMESASYAYANLNAYKNVFNWTFTYRLDSDFPNFYDRVYRRDKPLPPSESNRNYAEGKTKVAAWFVSNCHTASGREKLVNTLSQWIPVDQFGACGPLKCPRNEHRKCLAMLEKDYKFYFSFENSLCQDYVTEKFFSILRLNVVPVVYGLGNYSAIAPPHSYIDALSFSSAKALAQYLLYLHKNDSAYNEYFKWKRFHHFGHDWAKKAVPFCELCEQLHRNDPPKTYDMTQWFIKDSHCKTKSDRDIAAFIHGNTK